MLGESNPRSSSRLLALTTMQTRCLIDVGASGKPARRPVFRRRLGSPAVADRPGFRSAHLPREACRAMPALCPIEPQPSHVRHVKQGRGGPRRQMLVRDRRVLHRHRPAGKIDHAAAVGDVPSV